MLGFFMLRVNIFLFCSLPPSSFTPYFLSSFLKIRFFELQKRKNNRNLSNFHFSSTPQSFTPPLRAPSFRLVFVLTSLFLHWTINSVRARICIFLFWSLDRSTFRVSNKLAVSTYWTNRCNIGNIKCDPFTVRIPEPHSDLIFVSTLHLI